MTTFVFSRMIKVSSSTSYTHNKLYINLIKIKEKKKERNKTKCTKSISNWKYKVYWKVWRHDLRNENSVIWKLNFLAPNFRHNTHIYTERKNFPMWLWLYKYNKALRFDHFRKEIYSPKNETQLDLPILC